MASNVFFPPNKASDANGNPKSGAKAYFFDTGTTSPQGVFADVGLTTPHAVPLVADAAGVFADVFTNGSVALKVNVTDAADVQLPGYPIDPAISQDFGAGAGGVSFAPTADLSSTTTQDAIEEVDAKVRLLTSKGADIASAAALTLGSDAYYFDVTGTAAITSINTVGIGTEVTLHFDNVLTLTHNATDLVLPNGTNITTYAGYVATFREYAAGDWELVSDNSLYQQGTWTPDLVGTSGGSGVTYFAPPAGSFFRVGNAVTVNFNFTLTSLGTLAGFMKIQGLPFASTGLGVYSGSIGRTNNLNITAGQSMTCDTTATSSEISLWLWDQANGNTLLSVSEMTSSSQLSGSITYIAGT